MSPRARSLPPAERRAALVKSAIELLRTHRRVPSTREIASAAGVAEGTIFKAFATKEELIEAAAVAAFCPIPFLRQLESVDRGLPLRERLVAAVGLLQERFVQVFELMEALGLQGPPPSRLHDHRTCTIEEGHRPSDVRRTNGGRNPQVDATRFAALIAPDADRLRCTPAELANYLRLLTFSGSHPKVNQGPPLAPERIVDLVLNGVQKPRAARASRKGTR